MPEEMELELPTETFRIRPFPNSKAWFLVHVSPDLTRMRATMRKTIGDCHPKQVAASLGLDPVGRAAKRAHPGICGVLFFAKTWLGAGLVAHELSHAAFRVCERHGIRVQHWRTPGYAFETQPPMWRASDEEKYCNFVEYLTRDFWRQARERQLVS